MVEPITIIIGSVTIKLAVEVVAAFAVAVAVVAIVAFLRWDDIKSWFQTPKVTELVEADLNNYGILIKEKLNSGNIKVIKGVLNVKRQELVYAEAVEAQKIDEELEDQDDITILA